MKGCIMLQKCTKKHKLPGTAPYGSVWAHICTGWFPRALGSLWDASWPPKPTKSQQKSGFGGPGALWARISPLKTVAITRCNGYCTHRWCHHKGPWLCKGPLNFAIEGYLRHRAVLGATPVAHRNQVIPRSAGEES